MKLIDYKGKHYIIQDKVFELDYVIGEISKEEALRPAFIKNHKASCLHYGIPPYIGDDEELKKVYK